MNENRKNPETGTERIKKSENSADFGNNTEYDLTDIESYLPVTVTISVTNETRNGSARYKIHSQVLVDEFGPDVPERPTADDFATAIGNISHDIIENLRTVDRNADYETDPGKNLTFNNEHTPDPTEIHVTKYEPITVSELVTRLRNELPEYRESGFDFYNAIRTITANRNLTNDTVISEHDHRTTVLTVYAIFDPEYFAESYWSATVLN
jgi:hypothetical protein